MYKKRPRPLVPSGVEGQTFHRFSTTFCQLSADPIIESLFRFILLPISKFELNNQKHSTPKRTKSQILNKFKAIWSP